MNPTNRRNFTIRSIALIAGDLATGMALASACTWLIETAALGLFLSFMAWLLAMTLSLALSQYLVHPAVRIALSDRKLDGAVFAMQGLARTVQGWLRPPMPA
ncbi:MAG: hypothetical protein KDF56_08130 [Ottowia sp.]|nr:hypothetical protein [Ottowia sp.]